MGLSSITAATAVPPHTASGPVSATATPLEVPSADPTQEPSDHDTETAVAETAEPSPSTEADSPTEFSTGVPSESESEPTEESSPSPDNPNNSTDEPSVASETPSQPQPSDRQHSRATPRQAAEDCTYAAEGSDGAYADTLCWIDFSTVDTNHQGTQPFTTEFHDVREGLQIFPRWRSVLDPFDGPYDHTGDDDGAFNGVRYGDVVDLGVNVNLGSDLVLTARLDVTGLNNRTYRTRSRFILPFDFPTYSGAFLGNDNFYALPADTGVLPALYQASDDDNRTATTEITLKDIQLLRTAEDGSQQQVYDYSIVVADAESTDTNEYIEWSTTGTPFEWLPNTPGSSDQAGVMGNACDQSFAPALDGSSTTAECYAQSSSSKTGTPMLHTAPSPDSGSFNVTTEIHGTGQQGIAFGIITSRTEVNVEVEDRVLDANGTPITEDQFEASMSVADTSAAASTGDGMGGSTGALTSTVRANGSPVTYATEAAGPHTASYSAHWTCTKTDVEGTAEVQWPQSGAASEVPPPADNPGDFAWLMPGEFIGCTVTYKPPYLTLAKEVNNDDTDATNVPGDFSLRAEGTTVPGSAEPNAESVVETAGASPDEAQRFPVTVGHYQLTEGWSDAESEENWQHGYRWTDLTCRDAEGNAISGTDLEVQESADGSIEMATLFVPVGEDENTARRDISCTYANQALQPQLDISKISDVDDNELVEPGEEIEYTLTFDNSQGTAPIVADHVDHLRDVLDDADLNVDSITSDSLDVQFTEDPNLPQLDITGSVGAGETHQVVYTVTVKQQEEDFEQRESAQGPLNGYVLQNFLTPRLNSDGDDIAAPETCPDPGVGETANCVSTEDAISAWTVDKQSFPVDGARLNYGGNTHYVLSARKLNDETEISNLSFHDDLTHVFKSAGWDPAAAVPGGAKPRGIYFIDAAGNTLDANGEVNGDADAPQPAYGAEAVGEPATQDDRWILESQTIGTVPSNAVTAEMWFAVEAGQQTNSDIPGAEAWGGQRPPTGSKYVNYGFASGSTDPVQCALPQNGPDVSTSPDDPQPADETIAAACRTQHEVNSGHFTIRKDAVGTGINVPNNDAYGDSSTGLWNLVGHEFEIRDDINGQPSEHPSQYLCRVDYRPDGDTPWDGTFTAHPGDRSLDDWDAGAGDDSQTLNEIRAWNNDQTNVDDPRYPLPECGVFNAQPEGSGGQTGRYRGMNLQPVLEPGEQGEPRDFWLVETTAPTHQISLDGSQTRPVPGVQELAQPISFTMWPSNDGEHLGGPSFYGKRQLDVQDHNGQYLERCSPGAAAHQRPVACVNSTGYLMLVQDTVPPILPLTGGQWLGIVTAIGVILVIAAIIGIYLKRRRDTKTELS